MTMVPAPKLSSKPFLFYYGGCGGGDVMMSRLSDGCGAGGGAAGYNNNINNNGVAANLNDNCVLGSDLGISGPVNTNSNKNISTYHNNITVMVEEQIQCRTSNNTSVINDDEQSQPGCSEPPPPPPPDLHHHEEANWLQLGLGGGSGGGDELKLELNLGGDGCHLGTPESVQPRVPLRPLDLFGGRGGGGGGGEGGSSSSSTVYISGPPQDPILFSLSQLTQPYPYPQQRIFLSSEYQQQQVGWGQYVNYQIRTSHSAAGCCSSLSPSSSSSMPPAAFLTRPFTPVDATDSEFRLIHPPPRRPHSGIWFNLQASTNQSKEPFLPQLSKSYLRIKDGRMTIRLVMKYLANKLGLHSESEVEIRCRGQQLVPLLTLEHVRDNIWNRSGTEGAVTLLPDSSTADHLMVLNYARTSSSTYPPPPNYFHA